MNELIKDGIKTKIRLGVLPPCGFLLLFLFAFSSF